MAARPRARSRREARAETSAEGRLAASRQQILAAARELFSRHGPEQVTMAELAEHAGVARATVFNQFGSKRALVDAITEDVLSGYVVLLEAALADRDTPVPVHMRTLFEQMGEGIAAERRFYRHVFREIARLTLGIEESSAGRQVREEALDLLEQLLTRGQARGELSRSHRAQDLASAFDGLVFGTITHWLYDDESEPLRQRMRRAVEILLSPLETEPDATPPVRALRRGPAPRRRRGRRRRKT